MIIITDLLKSQFDEGAKVTAFNLIQSYIKKYSCEILTVNGNCKLHFDFKNFRLNKLLFNKRFYSYIKYSPHKKILYIPNSSITFATFIRAKLLRYFTSKHVHILSFQPRSYNSLEKKIIKMIPPKSVITQTYGSAKKLEAMGIKSKVLPLGVDVKKFQGCGSVKKGKLREKYFMDTRRKILLHVGHIRKARNLEWLVEVKKNLPDIIVLVVGSTSTYQDEGFRHLLRNNGIVIISSFIKSIEEVYQMADFYVFTVVKREAAIETPLSVLEAMATNLPILATRFGSLQETFQENEYFRFINSSEDIVDVVKKGFPANCKNRERILPFIWEAVADKLHNII